MNSAQKTGKSLLLSVLLENPKADTSTLLETLEHLVMDVSDHYEQFGTFIREHNAIVKKYRIHIRAIRDDTCNICLLSTQMESDPIAAEFYLFRVALAESPTQQSISTSLLTWPTLRDKLRLNPQQSCTIFKQLIQSKCLMVDCLTKPSAARGDSPLGDLSRKLRSGTRTASLEEGLLHMKPDGETESYHSILKKIGANLRSAILSQLSPSQRGTFLDLNTSSLLSIKTDLDPFSEQLEMENKSST